MFVVSNETMMRHGVRLLKGVAYRVTDNDDGLLEIERKDCWVDESEVRVYRTREIKEIISKFHAGVPDLCPPCAVKGDN